MTTAEATHDPATDTINVAFTRDSLFQFIEWCNTAKIRDDDGKVIRLEIIEYEPGFAILQTTVTRE